MSQPLYGPLLDCDDYMTLSAHSASNWPRILPQIKAQAAGREFAVWETITPADPISPLATRSYICWTYQKVAAA